MPAHPHSAGLTMIYPWESENLANFKKQLYLIAQGTGFEGTENDFNSKFGYYLSNKELIIDYVANFPLTGESTKLYFGIDTQILYYWNNEYIPVNAMLIADTIIDSGNALDEIGGD